MMGDFIHSLSAVKNICEKNNAKARIYLSDDRNYGGDTWRHGVDKAHADLKDIVMNQSYVDGFEVLSNQGIVSAYNLNGWRSYIMTLYMKEGGFKRCWSDFMSQTYGFGITADYGWLNIVKNEEFKDKVIIHRSTHRHNNDFPWETVLDSIKEDILFLTSSEEEFNNFKFKRDRIKLHLVQTMSDMAVVIGSCKYFVGNQSAPFALASSMDVSRLVELNEEASRFYMSEEKYSKNISWFLNGNNKHISENSLVKL